MLFDHLITAQGRKRSPTLATLAALAALATACGGSGSRGPSVVSVGENRTTVRATAAPPTTPAPKTTAAATTVVPSAAVTTVAAVDPNALLGHTVESLRPGYQFDSTFANGPAVVSTFAGRVVGTSSQLTVTNGGATVEYLQIPPTVWYREAGGEWSELATNAAPRQPLDGLAQPSAVTVVAQSAAGTTMHATYTPENLGITGGGAIEVDLTVNADGSMTVTYPVVASGKTLQVVEKLTPAADTSEIAPPG